MIFSVTQDSTRPEGGYAVLRLFDIAEPVEDARVQFQPLDEGGLDSEQWPRGAIAAVESRVRDGALEVVVGPEAVNVLPADAALQVTLTAREPGTGRSLDFRGECRWPALVSRSQRGRGRLPEVAQSVIAEAASPRSRRPVHVARTDAATQGDASARSAGSRPDLASPMLLAGDPRPPDESESVLRMRSPAQDTPPSAFGRNAAQPVARPRRSGTAVWCLVSLLVGLAIGFAGARFVLPASLAPTGISAAASSADRDLMAALDSPDTTPDGVAIFRTSKDDLWAQAAQRFEAGDFTAAAQLYRMAVRVSLGESGASALFGGLNAALRSQRQENPQTAGASRMLLALSGLAGDQAAFCRLAEFYREADPDYSMGLRERAAALGRAKAQDLGC